MLTLRKDWNQTQFDLSLWRQTVGLRLRLKAEELRRGGSGIIEVAFALMTISSGFWIGWPFRNPYMSGTAIYHSLTRDLPSEFWGAVFVLAGVWQMTSFLMSDSSHRFSAASFNAGLWAGVAAILLIDHAPGWMTAVCPWMSAFEIVVCVLLANRAGRKRKIKGA